MQAKDFRKCVTIPDFWIYCIFQPSFQEFTCHYLELQYMLTIDLKITLSPAVQFAMFHFAALHTFCVYEQVLFCFFFLSVWISKVQDFPPRLSMQMIWLFFGYNYVTTY